MPDEERNTRRKITDESDDENGIDKVSNHFRILGGVSSSGIVISY